MEGKSLREAFEKSYSSHGEGRLCPSYEIEIDAVQPAPKSPDPVSHPDHYTSHPSGIEAIQICEHENFNIGCALKYLMRYRFKGKPNEDLRKCVWYVQREIARLERREAGKEE